MRRDHANEHYVKYDRVATYSDEKSYSPDIGNYQPTIPDVGIFDEPTRCYKINHQWAKIVMGWVGWLTTVAYWPDAQDETYPPIREILNFLRGDNCMDCEQLNNCLEVSPTILNIANYVNNQVSPSLPVDPETTTPADNLDSETLYEQWGVPVPDSGDNCNEDAIWAACVQLIEYIDERNRDFLQQLAAQTNVATRLDRLLSAIPVFETLPLDEAIEFIDDIGNQALENYNAVVTTQLLEDTECELFCILTNVEPCKIAFADVFNYFSSRAIGDLESSATLIALAQFLGTGVIAGLELFYGLSALQLHVASSNENWFGVKGLTPYEQRIALGYNNPSSDWQILCTACDDMWCYDIDFTVADGNWYIPTDIIPLSGHDIVPDGSYVAGQGWQSGIRDTGSIYLLALVIEYKFPFDVPLDFDPMDGLHSLVINDTCGTAFISYPNTKRVLLLDGDKNVIAASNPSGLGNSTFVDEQLGFAGGSANARYIRLVLTHPLFNYPCAHDRFAEISSLTMTGTGVYPFEPEFEC